VGTAKAEGVAIVLQETYFPTTTGRAVADRAAARLVVVPACTDVSAGQTYMQHMDAMVTALTGGR
jgi:C4-dicarboxylate transporter